MDKKNIIKAFNKCVNGRNLELGSKIKREHKVLNVSDDYYEEENDLNITGVVRSDKTNQEYECSCNIGMSDLEITYTDCECHDFFNNMYNHDIYACKHIAAMMLKYIESIDKEEVKVEENALGLKLLKVLKEEMELKELVNIDVSIYRRGTQYSFYYEAEFKIGNKRMYSLKNLKDFRDSRLNNENIVYGKEFTYNSRKCYFSDDDENIISYIDNAIDTDRMIDNHVYGYYHSSRITNKKLLRIAESSLRTFLYAVKHRKILYNGIMCEILQEDLPLEFQLNDKGEEYSLNTKYKVPEALSNTLDVFMYDNKIYLPSRFQTKALMPLYKFLSENKSIEFPKELAGEIFNNLIPKLKDISNNINIDNKINNIIKEELKVEFYFDIVNKNIIVDVKLIYGEETLNFFNSDSEKIIIRDSEKERQVIAKLNELNIISKDNVFTFIGDDENLYDFLCEDYKELEEYGEVYYSEKLKNRKIYKEPSISAGLGKSEGDYLEFSFNIEDINSNEYKNILNAFRENKRFYKLKDNSFISLENKKTKEFLSFVDAINYDKFKGGNIELHKNKSFLINSYIEANNLGYISGKEIVEEVVNKLNTIEELNCEVPKELNGTLREYQITGFKWFKTLSYLGFGGVLADEMGLGKTIQTISFLLSEKDKKSLIIAPTSLIYNWKKEFERFAPDLNVGIVHGSKKERLDILKELSKYNVILTTYGTLRNDEEDYRKLDFDYCIIDEAQNIKNPTAQCTKMVKEIKANVKFALTGTPIENNLIELWSIFDFIMPGYLYTSTLFKKSFIDKDNTIEKLQNYIKPFMLRRLKRDVIKELPEKIEKKYFVELTKEQKKVYSRYVNDIKSSMDQEDFEGNKITIFSYLTKLRQLCLDPKLILDSYSGGSGKLQVAVELIQNSIGEGHKVLLFSQFTSMLEIISEELNKNKIKHYYLDGATKANKRLELVESFNSSEDTKVFLISLKAGGTGLNLTSADIVIHFDPWWNPAIEEQATDRAHRIGQENVVEVFKIIAEGTVEERIVNLQEEKKTLINNVMSEGYEQGNILTSLSKEELKALFQ